ncbi:MAG TPA: AAA family ATPase [Tenuifilaceae bacterium]|nr:AAA family ATPase [Tenuifilaceae bacterium]HPE18326.1 AAA family ATPase [Tenuifilaceae bacterium]HPJ45984.1 AAA family ATPase [Tenuifilaceae bacterium]HPQ34363.1 AAA family ATPase [Tenuifilaceae bacterium]HRX68305.1 AAA family ATPase [Tenuifilaceae bacterium]
MEKNQIYKSLIQNLGFELTKSQEIAADLLADFATNRNSNFCFLLKGFAGTGKTTLIASLVKTLTTFKVKVVLLAPTGRAAKVLSHYSGFPAFTIHKWIYRQKSLKDAVGRFVLDKNLAKNCVFIVDEASMISNSSFEDSVFGTGRLLDDLVSYVSDGENCRLILVGDEAQLPPVKLDISPALNRKEVIGYGIDVEEVTLSNVVRQAEESGILRNATTLRTMLEHNDIRVPKFDTIGYNDFIRISGSELLELLETSYDRVGMDETVVLNYSNKRANKYNEGIRNKILWRESEISQGDFLMVVRNNYFWVENDNDINFIANGDIVEVMKIKGVKELHGFRFADATLRLIDYNSKEIDAKIILDTLWADAPSLNSEQNRQLFESVAADYSDISTKPQRMKKIKSDPYFNALQVKFAYAVTCHKAQGGQWKNVFIDQGFFKEEMISREYLRWLYTAITRATEKVFLVNFAADFFEQE